MRQDAACTRGRGGARLGARHAIVGLCVGVLLAAGGVAMSGAAGAASPSTAPAFTSLGRCLAQHHRLLLAFVMDESGSLGDAARNQAGTDPTAQRVTAAQVAVQGLTDLADRGVQVKVLLSGFSDNFHRYGGWQTLDQAGKGSIANQLESFRTRDYGLDTDFYAAIAGAQGALSAEAAAVHGDSCQVVLLFTDGRFDIATTVAKPYDANGADPDATKVAKGIAALCAPNGPMQKLRQADGQTVTLALADPSAPSVDQPDRALLARLATGDCSSPGSQYGASFDAANASDLVDQFDAVVSNIRGGTQRLGGCVGSANAFDIVPALGSFHVLVDAGTSAQSIVVTAPNHRQLRVSASGSSGPALPGLTVRAAATSNRFVSIDASPAHGTDAASSAWTGRWTVNFAGAQPGGTCQVFLFNAWKPVLRPVALQSGRSAQLVADLVDASGRAAPLSDLRVAHSLTATITSTGRAATPAQVRFTQRGGHFEAAYVVPRSLTGHAVTLSAVFHVLVSGADVASSPSSVRLPVVAGPAAGAPSQPAAAGADPGATARTPTAPAGTNKVRLALIAVLVVLVALLLVVFVASGLKKRTRRRPSFIRMDLLRAARVPVRVRVNGAPTRVAANGSEMPFAFRDSDFAPCLVARGPTHAFAWNDLTFEAVARRRLFDRGHGEVRRAQHYVTASGGTVFVDGYTKGVVPLDLRGTWVYELASRPAHELESFVDGYVTVFVAADKPIARQSQRLVDSFNSFLTEIVLRLAKHAPTEETHAPTH